MKYNYNLYYVTNFCSFDLISGKMFQWQMQNQGQAVQVPLGRE